MTKPKVTISTEPKTGKRHVYRPKLELPATIQVAVESGKTTYFVTILVPATGIPMTQTLEVKK